MVDQQQPEPIADPNLPALALLLGREAVEVLDTVLAEAGGRCKSARCSQVRYVPAQSVTAQYAASVKWIDGSTTNETLVAASGIVVPDDTPVLQTDDVKIAVWRYPNDPFLPGLGPAADSDRVHRLLKQLGAPTDIVRLRRRAYRPGRRAVIEAVSPRARMYLKVVRPDRVAALQAKHSAMAGHIPVPHSYGWSKDLGLVAMQAMPGKTLCKALESGTRRLPTGPELVALLGALPDPPDTKGLVLGPAQRAADHARLLKAVTPEHEDRVDAVVGTLTGVVDEPTTAVHGDFHSSQILTKGGSVVGLIDVDTTGRGTRTADLAGLIGHLSTLALGSSARRNIERYGAALIADFDRMTDPATLRLQTAAVVLGLATGPFRVQQTRWPVETERRISLAERWIDSAKTQPPVLA